MRPYLRRSPAARTARARAWRPLVLLLPLQACLAGAAGRAGLQLSSEASDYSPTVRLTMALARADAADSTQDGWRVHVDSAVVSAPGTFVSGAPAIMRDVRMSALVVRFGRPVRDSALSAAERPWTVLARSPELPVADSLHYGERLRVPRALEFALPAAPLAGTDGTGIVFQITAAAVSVPVRLADGTLLPGRVSDARVVRVYACSAFRLDGRVDRRRRKALERRYTAVC